MARFEELRSMRERSGDNTEYPRNLPGIPTSDALPPSLNAPMVRPSQLPEGYGFERTQMAQATPGQLPSGHSFERPTRRSRPLDNPDIQVLDQMQRNQPGMPSQADREALKALIEQYGFANPPR